MKKFKQVVATFEFKQWSRKQKQVLSWWVPASPVKGKHGIICDGSIRAGKTIAMSISFVDWAEYTFKGRNLAFCGKTIGSLRRNVIQPLKQMLKARGIPFKDHRAENYLTIGNNDYYLFGGKDEASQDLIQGITLAGVFFDEVALQVESFVNQAVGRCSVEGSKYWFNCNPEGPYHWFKREWIDKAKDKMLLHLHFTMEDNLTLSQAIKQRYYAMYSGVFFKRYILGLWVMAEGVIFDMFKEEVHIKPTQHYIDLKEKELDHKPDLLETFTDFYVCIDYGTDNPCTFALHGYDKYKWKDGRFPLVHVIKEYWWDSKKQGRQKTDSEYANDLEEFTKVFIQDNQSIEVYVDPSAASFILELKRRRHKDGPRKGMCYWNVLEAENSVLDGIRFLQSMMSQECITWSPECKESLREMYAYVWDEKAQEKTGEDKPIKQNDHTRDRDRYGVYTRFGNRFAPRESKQPQYAKRFGKTGV